MITAVLQGKGVFARSGREGFLQHPSIREVLLLPGATEGEDELPPGCRRLEGEGPLSGLLWNRVIQEASTPYLLYICRPVSPAPGALERLLAVAEESGAGIVYGDYGQEQDRRLAVHPLIDYQLGSIRDTFAFGPLILISTEAARRSVSKYGPMPESRWAGWYDLRLKIATDRDLVHLPECLGLVAHEEKGAEASEGHFAYVDPRNRPYQQEMEEAATAHLRRLGAWLSPCYRQLPPEEGSFPCEASVIIPVKDRSRTISEAVLSALSQDTDFPYNVIVVDNHSTDGTTEALAALAARHPRLHHLVPKRRDLNIGGCWNEAVNSPFCGRYAVQLDSDDLYQGKDSLQRLVSLLRQGGMAVVIGSYTIVDEALREIPPGLVDHREWTEANGRNNALRINGLGAPRAFVTSLVRKVGFPNVSYGEDYAVCLRLSREYRIGRIYDSLYLCRRWPGNSDARLGVEQTNRNDAYKDRIRTLEILARRRLNEERGWRS